MSDEPIGYEYNDGGISNQKLALFGLCLRAANIGGSNPRRIHLPKIYNRDQTENLSTLEKFEDVFWADIFHGFLARWKIEVVAPPDITYEDRFQRGGWTFFCDGGGHLRALLNKRATFHSDIAADFFRSLVPRVTSTTAFKDVCSDIFSNRDISIVAQMRIEKDWHYHTQIAISPLAGKDEDIFSTAQEIAQKIVNTIPVKDREIFIVCDEAYLPIPKEELRKQLHDEFAIKAVWKSDALQMEAARALSPLENSLLDFEVALRSSTFIGLTRSTFSNLVSLERFARTFAPPKSDYIYNRTGPSLGLRTDFGTAWTPTEACAPIPA